MKDHKTIMKGMTGYLNQNLFKVVRLHYDADPIKNTKWIAKARAGYPYEELWRQEMELDFISTQGRRVYPEFTLENNVADLKPVSCGRIWRGWDFGYHHPICVWAQRTEKGALHVLAELMGEDIVIDQFAKQVVEISNALFPGTVFFDAGDPACRQVNDKSQRTTADILRILYGIRIQSRVTRVHDGVHLIRAMALPRPDGFIRLKVNKTCENIIDAFIGGYVRDDFDEPVKDHYYEHLMDALRYLVVILFDLRTGDPMKARYPFARERETASKLTGY